MKKLLIRILPLILTFSLTACSGSRLSGTWEHDDYSDFIIKFFGSTIEISLDGGENFVKGKYSITGDQIEIKWDGFDEYDVGTFSRTKNTLTIDGDRFIKK